jgi:hypothetical protein
MKSRQSIFGLLGKKQQTSIEKSGQNRLPTIGTWIRWSCEVQGTSSRCYNRTPQDSGGEGIIRQCYTATIFILTAKEHTMQTKKFAVTLKGSFHSFSLYDGAGREVFDIEDATTVAEEQFGADWKEVGNGQEGISRAELVDEYALRQETLGQ